MWNSFLGAMSPSTCPICGSAAFTLGGAAIDQLVTQQSFGLVDCSKCGFRLTSPRPGDDEIGMYYCSEEYHSHNSKQRSTVGAVYRVLRRFAISAKSSLIRRLRPLGPVLDLGCGTGELLAELNQHGLQVVGVEPSEAARAFAVNTHGLRVFPGLGSVPRETRFGLIMLWHVLEHIPDPSLTLSQINKLLADGGSLLIAVPNRGSFDCEYYGPNWAAWDVPRHLLHFRTEDMLHLLSRHGFHIERMKRMWLDAFYIALLSERHQKRSSLLAWPIAAAIGLVSNLAALLNLRPSSSTLFIATKRGPGDASPVQSPELTK